MRVTQKTRRLFIFPSISHLGGIGQGGISREIPPGKYRPGISRTTLKFRVHTSRIEITNVLDRSSSSVTFAAKSTGQSARVWHIG